MPQSCNCCSDQVRCDDCYRWHPKTSSTRCQGAAGGVDKDGGIIPADTCLSYLCDGCEVRCWGCNLVTCEQHRTEIKDSDGERGHVQCDRCSLDIANSAVLDLAEALETMPAQFAAAVQGIVAEVRL